MDDGAVGQGWYNPEDDGVDALVLGVGIRRVLAVVGAVVMAAVFGGILLSL